MSQPTPKAEVVSLEATHPSGGERRFGAMIVALLQNQFDEARQLALVTRVQSDVEGPGIAILSVP